MKKIRTVSLAALLMASAIATSCDSHEPYDPDVHIGYILCDDHTCMDTATYFNQTRRKAIGVVFAERTALHPALIVNIRETSGAFCDSVGMSNGTSGDLAELDGFANTIAMYQSYNYETGKGSPIAMAMMDFHEKGQSDYIPSVAEQRMLQRAATTINPIIRRCGGTAIDTGSDGWYWTSTEVKENSGAQAWLCSSANGGIMPTPKTEEHKVRAILQFNTSE